MRKQAKPAENLRCGPRNSELSQVSFRAFARGMAVAQRRSMQFRELRQALQSIVLATLPACVGEVVDDDGVTETVEMCGKTVAKSFSFETPTDPALDLRVESCRVDAFACADLCRMLMARSGLSTPSTCAVTFDGDRVDAFASYFVAISGQGCPSEGRRPAGLVVPANVVAGSAIGAWLAQAAWLEAASIPAFVYLARELDAWGAPRGLARAAVAAARDEIRHAKVMGQLARRFGATPPVADVPLPKPRSLEAMAIENAVEGCVRETWGALVAMWQANRVRDAEMRSVFAAISVDEARHAALAWQIDQWVRTRLDAAAHARIDAAREAAVRELFDGGESEALTMLGLPHGLDARRLVERTRQTLWGVA
jgi:hypothetical protein